MQIQNIQIETERLLLRFFRESDAKQAGENSRKPKVAHFMSDMVLKTEEDALNWIRWINNEKIDPSIPFVILAVELKGSQQCIGLIGIGPKVELNNEVEILFAVADEYQSRGYITEAGSALIRWAFQKTSVTTLVAIAKPDNTASNRVIEKLGFLYAGEREIDYDGSRINFQYYRLEKPVHLLEPMNDFFAARADGYDEHMLDGVVGCKEGYRKMAELLPEKTAALLDLGCGTGLELDEIFKVKPELHVTGIDLTKAMLDKLKAKHPDKNLKLINASYFDADLGKETFDAAVSFQTMHHFSHDDKIKLYRKIGSALKSGGQYIECDYMVTSQEEEDRYYRENARIRREQHIPAGAFYHYDTPCTVDNQISLLKAAGFADAKMVWKKGNTTMMVAQK